MDLALNIIYFLLSLTVLVSIHELGHLSMAKLFGVYCEEYAIGFGPKLFSITPKAWYIGPKEFVRKKPSNKETTFSIRCIPLGGYVAMAGEGMEDEDKLRSVPPHRFLQGIAKWKRAIIMVAGVVLNFVLGFLLLLGSVVAGPQNDFRTPALNVSYISNVDKEAEEQVLFTDEYLLTHIDVSSTINGETKTERYLISYGDLFKNTSIQEYVNGIEAAVTKDDTMKFVFNFSNHEPIEYSRNAVELPAEEGKEPTVVWEYGMYTSYKQFRPNFGETMIMTCDRFYDSCIAIYKALGSIFSKDGFNNLGGPIAIVQQQMMVVESGFASFLYFWGLISCNLAIFNLLPFPGLDGWHFLVLIIEGITKKDINPKVKSIMSTIGMILLFGLMIAVTIKDIVKLF